MQTFWFIQLGLESLFKLTLTQYNQNLYQINFIEFIIALSRYALFCDLSTEWHSHVTIYSEYGWMYKSPTVGQRNAVTQNRDTETPSHKISHDEYYEKRGTTDKTKHKPSMPQPRIRHTRITTIYYFPTIEEDT